MFKKLWLDITRPNYVNGVRVVPFRTNKNAVTTKSRYMRRLALTVDKPGAAIPIPLRGPAGEALSLQSALSGFIRRQGMRLRYQTRADGRTYAWIQKRHIGRPAQYQPTKEVEADGYQ